MRVRSDFAARYGPWAVITGASSGIGEHMARRLSAAGLNVVVCARRLELLDALAEELRAAHGTEVRCVAVDLADPKSSDAIAKATAALDVGLLICNAGFGLKGLHHEQDPARLEDMVAVNSLSPMHLARLFTPRLVSRGRGGIVLTSSIEGFFGYPWSAAYAASKAFTMGLGESLWGELRPAGVDVLVVAPGATDTDALALQGIEAARLQGLMSPAEVAERALAQLGRRPLAVIGATNKVGMVVLKALPLSLRLRLVGWGMKRTIDRSHVVATRD